MPTRRPRILVTTTTFPRWPGDTEPPFVFNLCNSLQQSGIDVDVLAPHAAGAKTIEQMSGMTVYRYRYLFSGWQKLAYAGGILANLKRNPLNLLAVPLLVLFQLLALRKLVRKNRYQLIHAHWLIPQGMVCALAGFITGREFPPFLCTSHGGDLYALQGRFFNGLKKKVIENSCHLTVVSQAMRRKVIAMGVQEDKVSVLPMGVDLVDRFCPRVDVPRNERQLLFTGRLVEKKGVSVLLNAMPAVICEFPDIELRIVGDGPLRPALEKQVHDTGLSKHVFFTGSVPAQQLPEIYSAATLAVVPSVVAASGDQEGLGLVIVEALGCGCPVIASDLEAIRDVLDREDSLARPGDAVDLANKIILLLQNADLRRELAGEGMTKVRAGFDQRQVTENYLRLLTRSMGAN